MIKYIQNTFTIFSYLWYIFYAISLTNIYPDGKFYLDNITYFYYLFIGSILLISFNPFYRFKYNEIYGQMAFSAALHLILSLNLMEIFNRVNNLEKRLKKDINLSEKLKIIFNLKSI